MPWLCMLPNEDFHGATSCYVQQFLFALWAYGWLLNVQGRKESCFWKTACGQSPWWYNVTLVSSQKAHRSVQGVTVSGTFGCLSVCIKRHQQAHKTQTICPMAGAAGWCTAPRSSGPVASRHAVSLQPWLPRAGRAGQHRTHVEVANEGKTHRVFGKQGKRSCLARQGCLSSRATIMFIFHFLI